MSVLTVILFPIRLIATGASFLLALALASAMTRRFNLQNNLKPDVSFERRILLPILVKLARFVYFCGGIHWVKVKGQRAPSKIAPILIAAPHSSFLDSLVAVLLGMTPVVTMTQHAESFIGGLIRVLQPVLVNREDPQSRKKTMKEICYRARSSDNWPQLLIFPEGTCTNRTCLVSFKQGAFQPGVPVQPVLLRWPNAVDSTTWVWEGPSVLKLLWMTMTQFHTFFEIEFLPVYIPNDEEQLDAQLYADNVRRKMAEALNVPTCDLVYDDFCRMRVALECRLPNPEAMVYLYSLIRSAFSHFRAGDSPLEEDKEYREWVGSRLNTLLTVARCTPDVSRPECINLLFPSARPDQRETLLLNLIFKHYHSESKNTLKFRRLITQACMFFFASEPLEGLQLAIKAYPSVNIALDAVGALEQQDTSDSWEINLESAKQLLSDLFLFEPNASPSTNEIVELASMKFNSSASNSVHEIEGVNAEQLYNGLRASAKQQLNSYASYEAELCRIFGSRGRPLIESRSTSASQLSLSSLSGLNTPDQPMEPPTTLHEPVLWNLNKSNGINNFRPTTLPTDGTGTTTDEQTESTAYCRSLHAVSRRSIEKT